MANPTINPAILLSPVENGYVAYDPISDRLHHLNPFAALMVELCDGHRDIEEIRSIVAPLMPVGADAQIDPWFEEAIKASLLIWNGDESLNHRELSVADLSNLTIRLKERGKVEPAFLCAKRVVELNPDDWDAWYELGVLAQSVGRRDDACNAYQKYFAAHPEDLEIEHLLVALQDKAPPPRASNAYIQHIYQSLAPSYETLMQDQLDYQSPTCLQNAIASVIGDRRDLAVLDLGCGSGLMGTYLKQQASQLVGVDLSPDMIEMARGRNIYDQLDIAEITDWLNQADMYFDLIVACECLNYFGDLRQIFHPVVRRLNPGGVFALTVERGDRHPFHLTDTGRYAHHRGYVCEISNEAGLTVARLDEGFLRLEYGDEVIGLYVILKNEREIAGQRSSLIANR